MNIDFFIGKKDEDIVKRAKALGFEKVIFIKEVSNINDIKKDDDFDAILIKTKNPEFFRRMVDKTSHLYSMVLVLGTTDIINRAALEHKKVFALVSPEYNREYDYTNYRNSGLNQVLCSIAERQKKRIMFSFNEILNKHREDRAVLIGKIMQNITLCQKYKTEIEFHSFAIKKEELRSSSDLRSFFKVLSITKVS